MKHASDIPTRHVLNHAYIIIILQEPRLMPNMTSTYLPTCEHEHMETKYFLTTYPYLLLHELQNIVQLHSIG